MFKLAILEKKNIVVEILTKDALMLKIFLIRQQVIDMNANGQACLLAATPQS
jgi:hypothetical protein